MTRQTLLLASVLVVATVGGGLASPGCSSSKSDEERALAVSAPRSNTDKPAPSSPISTNKVETPKINNTLGVPLAEAIKGEWRVGLPEAALAKQGQDADKLRALAEMNMTFDGATTTITVMGQSESKAYQVEAESGDTLVVRTTDASNRVLRITFEDRDSVTIKDDRQSMVLNGTRFK